MGLPGREFYQKDDEKSKQIREKYVAFVAQILELSGESKTQAAGDASSVMRMETAMANAAMDIVLRRDPKNLNNKMSLEQVQALAPSFNWTRYFAAMQAPASPHYLVLAPEFYRGMEQLIATDPLNDLQAYLRYSTVRSMANSLSEPFVEANFNFFGKTLSGAQKIQPRWRRCSIYADADLGEAVGQAYTKKYFPPESKERMLQLVKALETALNQEIDALNWMSPETKAKAHEKLKAQIDKIAYPDQWRDYSSVEIKTDDFRGNVERSSQFEIKRRLRPGRQAN